MQCLVVDDDPMSRAVIEHFVAQHEALTLVGSCESAIEAANVLQQQTVDLVFLDVEMPEMTGIELVKSLAERPQIVMVSSKEDYAREAFDASVTDYLLKPVSHDRFLKAVERARQQELADIQTKELEQLKSTFLANMNHEIRTPLTGILSSARLLEAAVDEEYHIFTEIIETNGLRLLSTLTSIIDLAQLEAGDVQVFLEPTLVSPVVAQIAHNARPQAVQKGIALQVIDRSDSAQAMLDKARFEQLVFGLIDNAIKFTDRGEVNIVVETDDRRVFVRVCDTGVGVEEDFREEVFEAFKQESAGLTRSYEGLGLGLTIAKRYVDLMDGAILVESTKGDGSMFTVSFPLLDYTP